MQITKKYMSLKQIKGLIFLFFVVLTSINVAFAANLKGTVQTADGTPMCALAIASGHSMFTCSPPIGTFSFTDLPLEPDGSITLQLYADGFYPNVQSLNEFSPQQVVMKPAQVCGGGGGGSTNKQKTESLIGQWHFHYTIISGFDDYYTLHGPAAPFDAYPGNYLVYGTDTYGNSDVAAGYIDTVSQYVLADASILIDNTYFFDYVSADVITGCYYQRNHSDGSLSDCYPLTGTRISSAFSASTVPLRQVYKSPSDVEEQKVREVEASSLARASLSTNSVRTLEETRTNAEAEKISEKMLGALQAR
jgi:hypothetical protein